MISQSVADVMTPTVRTVTPEATAGDVARVFAANDIGSVVVVAPGTDRMVGIVTQLDVMRQVAGDADVTAVPVGSFMSAPVHTVSSAACIHAAATRMKEHSVQRLPVVDDGELVGILTTTNLAHYVPRLRREIRRRRTATAP